MPDELTHQSAPMTDEMRAHLANLALGIDDQGRVSLYPRDCPVCNAIVRSAGATIELDRSVFDG